ncbi:hypothetical protein [Aureispira anguillae]|uniref:GIY-YIG domain-containing protein n=1 Tax=Aureispira anguillae TaxID=2864201 RepID=A0A915YDA8_9BACT|nr:hypothetical protein [Aureispira anguillae]BDS10583.1 hypothetical protein AsAng_0012910 [Aureispira anguillae]BDS10857.1 hypothetical protein AsAng_0015670 [Aureispira anguillae]BDS10913.1 hypothetical protein AsAng_0016230 [Aureispira anguillae]BDS10963.1 hypothetical protein AsAng_0016730 [Aureispira anguillae]BDS12338.1 hypothetical protein AsAng_0030590 [Aureispira anguillae]
MNRQEAILTVQPPFPKKQLGRYRSVKGIYLIRFNDQVIYIGASKNIYKGISRLYQKGGVLSHLSFERCTFEVILSNLKKGSIEQALKGKFKPKNNHQAKTLIKYQFYRKHQHQRILVAYQTQSRFSQGEHKSDSENQPKTNSK